MVPDDPDLLAVPAYEQIAERYAEMSESNAYNACYERPATLSLLPDVTGLRVLDAGCGPGFYARLLAARGARVTAIDASPEMLRIAAERVPPSVVLRRASIAQPLEFLADASIDLVISPLVLDSIKDWRPVMRELARVLVPEGLLVFSVGHPMADFALSPTHRYFEVELTMGEWSSYGVVVPAYRRPFNEIFAPLHDAGFVVERVLEAEPTDECRTRFPEAYRKLTTQPWFLHVRARRR